MKAGGGLVYGLALQTHISMLVVIPGLLIWFLARRGLLAFEAADAVESNLAGGQDLSGWGHPLQTLEALQQDSGAFAFNAATPGDNLLATIQAIPAGSSKVS